MNLTGPPIALHSTDYLAEQLNTPRYNGAQNLRDLIANNAMWTIEEESEYSQEQYTIVSERLLGVVFGVSAQIVEEDICSMEDVDRGAKVGLRWARGPFEMMNRIGVEEAYRMASAYQTLAGDTWKVPSFLKDQSTAGKNWDFSYVDSSTEDGIATITINRPEAMNALNEVVVAQLTEAVQEANADSNVSTIVLDGAGKAFVAGADVKFFVDKIRSDDIPDIEMFTENGHILLAALEDSSKTTIALTTGLALGGGLELALACDYRIGTRRTQFRFPETSIGIYPALGGTQRPARIAGRELGRWAVLAGNFMNATTASDLGLVTHLVDVNDVPQTIKNIHTSGKPEEKYPGKPLNENSPVVKFARKFFSDGNMATLLSGGCPEGFDVEDKTVARQLKSLKFTAPIGLAMASERIDATASMTLAEGLELELQGLDRIFSTEDALEGLSALIEGRRATYKNA
tara:strand:- start:575 stop:1951 length:1377 start_codon:yes stop_codon:yes gene_type:complete